jgi:hypothetical protein
VRNHLPGRMRAATLHHTEMVRELTALEAAVSPTSESVLGRSHDETFPVEVVDELVAEFQKLEELCSRLEWPSASFCDLLLGPPFG